MTSFTYDLRNRLSSMTDPLTHTESYAYDARGNRTRVTDRNGRVRGYAYDLLDRLTSAGFGATVMSPRGLPGHHWIRLGRRKSHDSGCRFAIGLGDAKFRWA